MPTQPVFFLSAPTTGTAYSRSVVPGGQYRSTQGLFGFDAQLTILAELAAHAGCKTLFLPTPEIFSTPQSFQYLIEQADLPKSALQNAVHLHFGPVPMMRVCKGMLNIAVIASDPEISPTSLDRHPFAASDRLPAAFRQFLYYEGAPAPSISSITGLRLSGLPLPSCFIAGDLREGTAGAPGEAEQGDLFVQSLAEYHEPSWTAGDGPTSATSKHFSREVSRIKDGAAGGLIILPWNLSYPASLVPDLLLKIIRFGRSRDVPSGLIIFPYNETPILTPLGPIVDALRREVHASPDLLERIFLAQAGSPQALQALHELLQIAWIDTNDPEWVWTARRLGAIGIPVAILGGVAPQEFLDECLPDSFCFPADEWRETVLRDALGTRWFRIATLTVRGLAELIDRSSEVRSHVSQGRRQACSAEDTARAARGFFQLLMSVCALLTDRTPAATVTR